MIKAVIDVGSNSVILLVEELSNGKWTTISEKTSVTSLGEGTKQSGLLGEKGMANTLEALKSFFKIAYDLGASDVQAGVTMAGRIAKNANEFLTRAEDQKTPAFILTGEQEAELGFKAVALDPMFFSEEKITIIDVGGQSTELVTADKTPSGWDVTFRRSYPIGTLALLSGSLSTETPTPPEVLRASAEIDDIVGLAYLPNQVGKAIVLGATGTNLVCIREHFETWQPDKVHGAYLDYEEVSKGSSWLFGMTFLQRADLVGMEKGREKTLPIGALILERFLFATRSLGCHVSIKGWRHALLESGIPANV